MSGGPRARQRSRGARSNGRDGHDIRKPGQSSRGLTRSDAFKVRRGRGRSGRGRGGRGRSEGKRKTQKELDDELDKFLLKDPERAKQTLDDELESYMQKAGESAEAEAEVDAT